MLYIKKEYKNINKYKKLEASFEKC